MHDGVTIIWDAIVLALVADVIGVFIIVFDVLLQDADMLVSVSPLLGVHDPEDMEELMKETSSALGHTPLTVRQLVIALQNNLGHIWFHGMNCCAEPGSPTRPGEAGG
jgi:hypothetical protein